MKKFLFIALLSLVTFGAKAYTVMVVNNTGCELTFQWLPNSSVTIPIPVPTTPPTPSPSFTYFDQSGTCRISSGNCCPDDVTDGSHGYSYNPNNNPRSTGFSFSFRKCGTATIFWDVFVSYDNTTDTFIVVIG